MKKTVFLFIALFILIAVGYFLFLSQKNQTVNIKNFSSIDLSEYSLIKSEIVNTKTANINCLDRENGFTDIFGEMLVIKNSEELKKVEKKLPQGCYRSLVNSLQNNRLAIGVVVKPGCGITNNLDTYINREKKEFLVVNTNNRINKNDCFALFFSELYWIYPPKEITDNYAFIFSKKILENNSI